MQTEGTQLASSATFYAGAVGHLSATSEWSGLAGAVPQQEPVHHQPPRAVQKRIHDPSAENHQQDGVRQNAPPDQLRQQQSQLQHLVGRKRLAAAEALLEAQWRAAHPTAATSSLGQQPELAPDNVGYRLLQHAGWREGSGLGSAGQGRVAPVAPVANKGTKGIGFDAGQGVQGRRQANAGEAAAEQQVHGLQEGRKAPPEPSAASLKIADLVAQELAGESMEAKVALHKAAAAAELEAARGRAIQRMLYTAFNDPFDGPGGDTANINPLRRNARLSAANPLLDSDEEGSSVRGSHLAAHLAAIFLAASLAASFAASLAASLAASIAASLAASFLATILRNESQALMHQRKAGATCCEQRRGQTDYAQPSPAQPSPAQPSPAQPSPAQPSPAQPSPAQPSPAQPSPAQPSPAQPSPAQPSPAQPSPAQPSPAQPSPAQPSPAQPSPAQPSPAQPSPAQPSPAQPSPAQPSPAQPSPAQPSPAQPSPAQPSPAQPSPAQPSPAQPSPAQPSPAQPSPAQPSPAQPSPAQPSPAQPSPAQPSPAQPSPAQPSPAQPSPAQPYSPTLHFLLR
ncbi:hypothetical protein QJQ45_001819 [Haematococcus lacustris]|nr:hypothetical protein QJQ45_001819 [Haematococcus lacustris]